MARARTFVAALCAALACAWLAGCLASPRLVETDLSQLPVTHGLGVPIVDPPKRLAGYFKLDRTYDARMFYFFFASRESPDDDPLVLWMTGGPGCSSELAILYENGPYALNETTLELYETRYGWDRKHNVIFVDQPINTGFSYSNDPRDRCFDESCVADDMLDFLQVFLQAHPDLQDRDFYVTGESYAGHYVPAVAHRVWAARKAGDPASAVINLVGLAIGNGLTDPGIQYGAYADYALQNKLIDSRRHDAMQLFYPICRFGVSLCNSLNFKPLCMLSLEFCQMAIWEQLMLAVPGINVYDITKKCEGALCYDFSAAAKFLNSRDVRAALGVGDRPWQTCSPSVYQDMMGDWMHNYDSVLPEMLADGVRVLIYAGELDLICNWLGNERWVDALEWEQAGAWRQVTPKPWLVGSDGGASGEARQLGPLTFLKVYKAGHMVPMDQPRAALDMITRFTRAIPFAEGGSLAQAVRGGAAAGSSQTRAAVRNKIVQIGAHGATGKAAPDALMAQR